jgi:hypothetical protein
MKPCRVLALHLVAQALQHRQLDQRLHPAHEGPAVVKRIFVVERDGFQRFADVFRQRCVHGCDLRGVWRAAW